jgi:hypothetical protein
MILQQDLGEMQYKGEAMDVQYVVIKLSHSEGRKMLRKGSCGE